MKRENIRALADHIEPLSHAIGYESGGRNAFYMGCFTFDDCGSPACIAGHAVAMSGRAPRHMQSGEIGKVAAAWLGLSWPSARELFMLEDSEDDQASVTPEEAAAVLRHLADTGEVDWSIKP